MGSCGRMRSESQKSVINGTPWTTNIPFMGTIAICGLPGGVGEVVGAGAGAGGAETEVAVRAVGGDEPQVGHMSHRRQKL